MNCNNFDRKKIFFAKLKLVLVDDKSSISTIVWKVPVVSGTCLTFFLDPSDQEHQHEDCF